MSTVPRLMIPGCKSSNMLVHTCKSPTMWSHALQPHDSPSHAWSYLHGVKEKNEKFLLHTDKTDLQRCCCLPPVTPKPLPNKLQQPSNVLTMDLHRALFNLCIWHWPSYCTNQTIKSCRLLVHKTPLLINHTIGCLVYHFVNVTFE
jgi:hypothetical protein